MEFTDYLRDSSHRFQKPVRVVDLMKQQVFIQDLMR